MPSDKHNWDDDRAHEGEHMRALANLMQHVFLQSGRHMGLCPACATAFVLARMQAYFLYHIREDGPFRPDADVKLVNEELTDLGKFVVLELQRLIEADGTLDGPHPVTSIFGPEEEPTPPRVH